MIQNSPDQIGPVLFRVFFDLVMDRLHRVDVQLVGKEQEIDEMDRARFSEVWNWMSFSRMV